MALITIQQAYALAMGTLVQYSTSSVQVNRGSISSGGLSTRATSLKTNKLDALLVSARNPGALNLADITYVNKGTGSSSTILIDDDNPDNNTYALVSSTVNQNGGSTFDYLEGSSSIDSTTGTLSSFESDLHKTGRAIYNKLKK
jgi:hypothetical protein